jgi:hypothetical protein
MDLGLVPIGMTVAALMAARSLETVAKKPGNPFPPTEPRSRSGTEVSMRTDSLSQQLNRDPALEKVVVAPPATATPTPPAAPTPTAAPEEVTKPDASQAVIFKDALKEGFKKGNSLSPALKIAKKDESVLQESVDGKSLIEWIVDESIRTLESKEFNRTMLGKISSFDYSSLLPTKMRTVKKDRVVMAAKNGGTQRNHVGGTSVSEISELTVLALKSATGAGAVNNAFKNLVTATSADIKVLKPIFDAFIKFRQNISDAYTIQQIRNAKFMMDGVFDNAKVNPFFEKAVIAETNNPEFASTGRSKLAEYQNDQALAERIQKIASKYDEAATKIAGIPDATSSEYTYAKRDIDAILTEYTSEIKKAEGPEGGPLSRAAAAAAKLASIKKENSIDEAETRAANIAVVDQEGNKADAAEAAAERTEEAAKKAAEARAAAETKANIAAIDEKGDKEDAAEAKVIADRVEARNKGRKRAQAILSSPPEIRDASLPAPTSRLRTRRSNFGVKSSLRTRQSMFKGGRHKPRKSTFRRHRKH